MNVKLMERRPARTILQLHAGFFLHKLHGQREISRRPVIFKFQFQPPEDPLKGPGGEMVCQGDLRWL